MHPSIEILIPKKIIGIKRKMTFAEDRTFDLWKSFMSRRSEISNKSNSDFVSMQVFDEPLNFNNFNPKTVFEKWAAVEVEDFENIPQGMTPFVLEGGLYAVFIYTDGNQNCK